MNFILGLDMTNFTPVRILTRVDDKADNER